VVSRCNKAHVMVYVWDIVQMYSVLCIDEDSLGGLVHKGCFVWTLVLDVVGPVAYTIISTV
jgi:hypothetical protein